MTDNRETPIASQSKDRCHLSMTYVPGFSTQSRVFISGSLSEVQGKISTSIQVTLPCTYLRSITTGKDPGLGQNVW